MNSQTKNKLTNKQERLLVSRDEVYGKDEELKGVDRDRKKG